MLPGVRVGRQPYGIVVTSDWRRWTFETPPGRQRDRQQLFALLQHAPAAFQQLAAPGRRTPRGDEAVRAPDPDCRPARQLGSNTSRARRVTDAYALEQLRLAGGVRRRPSALDHRDEPQARPRTQRRPPRRPRRSRCCAALAFLRGDRRAGPAPIVDRDPRFRCRSGTPIAAFDGTRNYLHWLATASLPN